MSAVRVVEPTSSPTWGGVGSATTARLGLLATNRETDTEWMTFVSILRAVARENGGRVDPNVVRPLWRAAGVHPRRVSAFYQIAQHDGVLTCPRASWTRSDDVESSNQGKPARVFDYTESPSTARRLAPGSHPAILAAPTRHVWRETVHAAWLAATHAWEAECEAVALGYNTEIAEYAEQHPRPRLADFMTALSPGREPS